ncbi:ubiquitin carboxyl-terminal hydrolase 43-like [Antedon mediterranea]|uniref:ubiquitin carboxyl-terminal hydrolase 43-like n=1 Tax=Antedon mediterranea TaxID=105859 RepID=UPI003AF8CEB7
MARSIKSRYASDMALDHSANLMDGRGGGQSSGLGLRSMAPGSTASLGRSAIHQSHVIPINDGKYKSNDKKHGNATDGFERGFERRTASLPRIVHDRVVMSVENLTARTQSQHSLDHLEPLSETVSEAHLNDYNTPRPVLSSKMINGKSSYKKTRKKPSLKNFGGLVQRMVRQMKTMDVDTNSCSSSSSEHLDNEPQPPTNFKENKKNTKVTKFHSNINSDTPRFLGGKMPGLSGLKNHGNTCFINSIIQCLSNTDMLAEYFVLEQYKQDLKRLKRNRNSKKFGTKGELTEQLAILLKALWSCQYTPQLSMEFKKVVARYGAQYRGSEQHDAQEFLMWLLDKVHEDLNSATKKKYKTYKNSNSKTDEYLAAEALANHIRCNHSFVHDLFQAQFRSSLTCPNCGEQSNTFDPFLCVSLPLPQRTTRPINVVVVYVDATPRITRFAITMKIESKISDLKTSIAKTCNITETRMILTEVYYDGFHRSFTGKQPLSDIHDGDSIYAIEITHNPQDVANTTNVVPFVHVHSFRQAHDVIKFVFVNQQGTGVSGRRFGLPVSIEVDRGVTFQQLQKVILKALECNNIDDALNLGTLFRLAIINESGNRCYIMADELRPLHNSMVNKMLQLSESQGEPCHVKAVIEWDRDLRTRFSQWVLSIYIEEDESVKAERLAHQKPIGANLFDCFDLYTKEEMLGEDDDAWHCSHCKKLQQGTKKKLGLWSLPDVLILHLKRFQQTGSIRSKLNTLVQFPVNGLDLSHYQERRLTQGSHTNTLNTLTSWSPWRHHRRRSMQYSDSNIYDLYAVCNHMGTMSGGHYTAYCKNPTDNQWYNFDDTKVIAVQEDKVITKSAYILFYHRRCVSNGSVSSGSSTSSSTSEHWVYRTPAAKANGYKHASSQGSSQDEEMLSEAELTEKDPKKRNALGRLQRSLSMRLTLRKTKKKHMHAPIPRMTAEAATETEPMPQTLEADADGSSVNPPESSV